MSNNSRLMDTEIGGEQTQYEGSHTFVEPHDKLAGQLGNPNSGTALADKAPKTASSGPNTQGVTPAEKMRYGQTIQESGGGAGRTDTSGQANNEGGFGGTQRGEERGEESGEEAHMRRAMGYGKGHDMDQNIGG